MLRGRRAGKTDKLKSACSFSVKIKIHQPYRPAEQSAALSDRNAEVLAVTAARCNNNAYETSAHALAHSLARMTCILFQISTSFSRLPQFNYQANACADDLITSC
jgi:hypothetical protein